MKITLIGTGYVGLVTGTCFAELGNQVVCLDVDADKIERLNQGETPIYEPGLAALIERNRLAGRLHFTTNIEQAVKHGKVQFIAVGTPPNQDGSADLQYVLAAARNIGRYMEAFTVVVNKSTVPVGTADQVQQVLTEQLVQRGFAADAAQRCQQGQPDFTVVSNPEFLKEGAAINDFMRPNRIVIGLDDSPAGRQAHAYMHTLYAPFNRNHERTLVMDVKSAEFTKYAANAMLATRISFMNELANLADQVGADIELVRQGIGSDPRIGYSFLYAGIGYGGSCFPKDVRALIQTAQEHQQRLHILPAVEAVNQQQKNILLNKILTYFGEDLQNRSFAIWGLAFKPNTNDMREAPSRTLIQQIVLRGASVYTHDPIAMDEAQRCLNLDLAAHPSARQAIHYCDSAMAAVTNADALIIVTEWKEFCSPDFIALKNALKHPVIFDGRNLYEPRLMSELGITYFGIGRATADTAHQNHLAPLT